MGWNIDTGMGGGGVESMGMGFFDADDSYMNI